MFYTLVSLLAVRVNFFEKSQFYIVLKLILEKNDLVIDVICIYITYNMESLKLEGCIYELNINNRPYIGQSRVLDKDKLPTKRWKRHIAESKCKDPKIYLYRAIRSNNLVYETLDKKVLEYIEHRIECNKDILSKLISKKYKSQFIKYAKLIYGLITDDEINTAELTEYIHSENDLTEEELNIISQIESFITKLNTAEEKWVKEKNSMMPDKGGIGYNHAPPGGALLHEPHSEEHKQYMSKLMSGRKLSEETKELLRKGRIGKPLSEEHKNSIANSAQKRFNETIFPTRYFEWVTQYKKSGYSPDSNSDDIDERKAGQWRQDMIKKYNSKYLNDDQITILNNTVGWLWKQPDEFITQFNNFKKQYEIHRDNLYIANKDSDNENKKTAINWIRKMRMMKKNNDKYLTEERIAILNSCEYWKWKNNKFISFDENVIKWTNFYEKNNRQPSMGKIANDEEKKIARWQNKTRIDYHNKEKRLTNEKIEKLSKIVGWTWKGC